MIALLPLCFGAGCCKKNDPEIDKPIPMPEKTTSETVKEPEPDAPDVKTVEQQRYEESKEVADQAKESFIPEVKKDKPTYFRVELKYFDDPEILKQVRYTIIQAAQSNNYTFKDEVSKNPRSWTCEIWSEMGPMSVEETISNALSNEGYRATVTRKGDELLVITPE
jgi:hypothetical protein